MWPCDLRAQKKSHKQLTKLIQAKFKLLMRSWRLTWWWQGHYVTSGMQFDDSWWRGWWQSVYVTNINSDLHAKSSAGKLEIACWRHGNRCLIFEPSWSRLLATRAYVASIYSVASLHELPCCPSEILPESSVKAESWSMLTLEVPANVRT